VFTDSTYDLHSELRRACTTIVMYAKLTDVHCRNIRSRFNIAKESICETMSLRRFCLRVHERSDSGVIFRRCQAIYVDHNLGPRMAVFPSCLSQTSEPMPLAFASPHTDKEIHLRCDPRLPSSSMTVFARTLACYKIVKAHQCCAKCARTRLIKSCEKSKEEQGLHVGSTCPLQPARVCFRKANIHVFDNRSDRPRRQP
jgi:hypothetical protein